MKLVTVLLVFTRFFCVENRMLSRNYKRDVDDMDTYPEESVTPYSRYNFATEPISNEDYVDEKKLKVNGIESYERNLRQFLEKLTEPCAIVVRSNIYPAMQSLLRKYRYDAHGALIPSSVKYFLKVPQGYGAPVLVPLNDNSVSHLGGYVRYYKEVPPIPKAL